MRAQDLVHGCTRPGERQMELGSDLGDHLKSKSLRMKSWTDGRTGSRGLSVLFALYAATAKDGVCSSEVFVLAAICRKQRGQHDPATRRRSEEDLKRESDQGLVRSQNPGSRVLKMLGLRWVIDRGMGCFWGHRRQTHRVQDQNLQEQRLHTLRTSLVWSSSLTVSSNCNKETVGGCLLWSC